jgi:hypothetical protein
MQVRPGRKAGVAAFAQQLPSLHAPKYRHYDGSFGFAPDVLARQTGTSLGDGVLPLPITVQFRAFHSGVLFKRFLSH